MSRADAAMEYLLGIIGNPYIYGGTGRQCTPAYRRQQIAQYPQQAEPITNNCPVLSGLQETCSGCKHNGKNAFDCAQLTRKAAEAAGITFPSGSTSQWRKVKWAVTGTIDTMPIGMLTFIFRVRADGSVPHTGTSLGDGTTVDARGHASGVVRDKLGRYPWTHWAMPEGLYPSEEIEKLKKLMGGEEMNNAHVLQQGDQNEDVREMQQQLINLGISVGDRTGADGIFGKATRVGVETFQRRSGLPVTGTWGPAEKARMKESISAKQPSVSDIAQPIDTAALVAEYDTLAARQAKIVQALAQAQPK